jgi:MarR family transcriptional regulator, transcriptional regulator for hemolysin
MDKHRNFGFLLKDLSRRYVLRFEARAQARIDLTLAQCKALVRLEEREGLSQKQLAQLAELEPMTMVRIIDRMEGDGLVERRLDPADRRARTLYLTAKGRALVDDIWLLAEETRAETFAGISRKDRDAFTQLLTRMHANLCALGEAPPAPSNARSPKKAARRRAGRRA